MLKMNENRWISQGFKSGIVEVGKKLIMNAYTWKTRVLVLEKRALVLYSVKDVIQKGFVSLRYCQLEVLPNKKRSFLLIVRGNQCIIRCPTIEEKVDWIKKIRSDILATQTIRQTLFQDFKEHKEVEEPKLVLDDDINIQNYCGTCHFIDPTLLDDMDNDDEIPEYMKALKSSFMVYSAVNKSNLGSSFPDVVVSSSPVDRKSPPSNVIGARKMEDCDLKVLKIRTNISDVAEDLIQHGSNDVMYYII